MIYIIAGFIRFGMAGITFALSYFRWFATFESFERLALSFLLTIVALLIWYGGNNET